MLNRVKWLFSCKNLCYLFGFRSHDYSTIHSATDTYCCVFFSIIMQDWRAVSLWNFICSLHVTACLPYYIFIYICTPTHKAKCTNVSAYSITEGWVGKICFFYFVCLAYRIKRLVAARIIPTEFKVCLLFSCTQLRIQTIRYISVTK